MANAQDRHAGPGRPSNHPGGKSKGPCFHCGILGHHKFECRKLAQERSQQQQQRRADQQRPRRQQQRPHQRFAAAIAQACAPLPRRHPDQAVGVLSCDNATCPVYTSAALIPSFPPFPPQTPHNCVSPPHSQLIDTCATPFRAPDPAIMLTDTMMPLCRIVPASYQEYPKYMPGICSSTPDLFNAASSANLLLLLPL